MVKWQIQFSLWDACSRFLRAGHDIAASMLLLWRRVVLLTNRAVNEHLRSCRGAFSLLKAPFNSFIRKNLSRLAVWLPKILKAAHFIIIILEVKHSNFTIITITPCDKFKSLLLSESALRRQNMALWEWSLVSNLFYVRPVSVQVLKELKMPLWELEKMK